MSDTERMRHIEHLKICYGIAKDSPDPRTQTGAIVLLHGRTSYGDCNHFACGVANTPERWDSSVKSNYVEHCERNAIWYALKRGFTYEDFQQSTLYLTWSPCGACANAIVGVGIRRVVSHMIPGVHDALEKWKPSLTAGREILTEAGVEIITITDKLGAEPVLFDGQLVYP